MRAPADDAAFQLDWARKLLVQAYGFRADGQVVPTWFVMGDEIRIVATPFEEGWPKEPQAQVVADMVSELHAEAVMLVSDVWMREALPGTKLPRRRPAESLEAVEAITVQCWRADGSGFTLIRQYRQRDDGRLQKLAPDELTHMAETTTFVSVLAALRGGAS